MTKLLNSSEVQSRRMKRRNVVTKTLNAYNYLRSLSNLTPSDIAVIASLKDSIKRMAHEQSRDRARLRKTYFRENREKEIKGAYFKRPLANIVPSANGTGKKALYVRFENSPNKEEFFRLEKGKIEKVFSSPEIISGHERFWRKQRSYLNELESLYNRA